MTHIYQLENKHQISVRPEISADKSRPAILIGFCYLCISITRKIDHIAAVKLVEVDCCRLSGNR